ncbi:MAG: L,D-transpeptidase [Chlamydiota bacterium]
MSFPKVLLIGTVVLFTCIGTAAIWKGFKKKSVQVEVSSVPPQVIQKAEKIKIVGKSKKTLEATPMVDQIAKLFVTDTTKLPIVETVTYTSRVPWLKGRPAWIADYASYYETSRHFIARSLNQKKDYFTQKVSPGDRFNVLKKGVQFYFLIELSTCKMWFYAIEPEQKEKILLKTYCVGLGRKDPSKPSGYLTPTGVFVLGNKVAIYKPGVMGFFQDRKIEMIRVFGTRWTPFNDGTDGVSKGYGIHGVPFENDPKTGQLVERKETLGKYESDGCIRLSSEDMEEIFAIVISKPTIVELVKNLQDANMRDSKKISSEKGLYKKTFE